VDPLANSVTNSLAEASRTLAEFRGAAENLRSVLAPTSPVRDDLDQALEQLAAAAQSVSTLVDFLKQHPNALISGRQFPKRQP
jgi:paraquat-inducible protein B